MRPELGRVRESCNELAAEIDRLESSGPSKDQIERLAVLEPRLFRLAAEVVVLDPEDAAAAPRELADAAVRDWRRLARSLALNDCRNECNDLLRESLREEAEAVAAECEKLLAPQGASHCNNGQPQELREEHSSALLAVWHRAGLLQLEAIAHNRTAEETQRRLADARLALERALEATPLAEVDDAQHLRWSNELADLSEAVLTAAEDLSPQVASAQMEQVARDIGWFLKHIETQRGPRRRRLRRNGRRLRNEAQERLLQGRLEQRFGRANVARFDQLILVLILSVFVLLFLETALHLTPFELFWLHLTDAAICCVFLWDFFVRLALAPHRGRWFARHFLIDLVPSLPYGLLLSGLQSASAADLVQLGRLVRLLRVQPLIRLFRALGFLARGIDRLARHFTPLLNRSVILYPTRAERARGLGETQRASQRVRQLHLELQDHWKQLVLAAAPMERAELARARLRSLRIPPELTQASRKVATAPRGAAAREVPAELVLRRLGGMTPRHVIAELGDEATGRLSRIVRIFSRPPLCWFPLIRTVAPRIGGWMSDSQIVAAAARQLAAALKVYHDRWFWLADLHGTVTPSVFVDRLGTMLVKGSFRPAYRLALFGSVYVLVYTIVRLMPFEFLARAEKFLEAFVGPAILLLGGVCCVVFSLGWWLKRLAREATEFYEQAAETQFLSLTEIIRTRHLERDARIFHHRVLRPEWEQDSRWAGSGDQRQIDDFLRRVQGSLLGPGFSQEGGAAFDCLQRVVLLYRDSLDGAMFGDNDNRTTTQLLGNPAVRQFLLSSLRIGRRHVNALRYLDLEKQKSLVGGPYLWFNFISRAVAHSVACLIVDYNRHAIPTEELPLVSEPQRRRYQRWLATRRPTNAMPNDVPASTDERTYLTTAFTALHFLDFDPQRDREVEARFGPELVERMQRDRSLLIRRIFGTYPWNLEPREKRVLNLFAVYERWLAGGRALFLPVVALAAAVRRAWHLTGWVLRAVNEIRRPELRVDRTEDIEADFATAIRKIDRMRGPVVYASLRLRSIMDPEYLGVSVPGAANTGLAGSDVQSDLQFLDAEPWLIERVEQDRHRAAADMRRLGRLIENGLLRHAAERIGLAPGALDTPAHRRAAAVAYLADFRGIRRLLSAREIIAEAFERAPLEQPQPAGARTSWALKRAFQAYCQQQEITKPDLRAAYWWAAQQNLWGVADALDVWRRHGVASREQGEAILSDILRHPGRITEQLVTLRTIQTLSILDVLNYRQHIYELGQYAAAGDEQDELLQWQTLGEPCESTHERR